MTSGAAHSADSVWDAMKEGKPTVQLRLRYESVDHDSIVSTATKKDHDALFMRTAIGYKTGAYMGFSAYVQLEDISEVGLADPDYETNPGGILDKEAADINMGYVQYANEGLTAKFGRQTIIYDNARHIGNVGWRMNDQTFDAATLQYVSGPFSLNYNYVWQTNRIVATEEDMDSHFINTSYKFDLGKLTGYYYKIDFDTNDGVPFFGDTHDIDTLGLRFDGKASVGEGSLLYTLEYGQQSDGADATTKYDADYLHGILGYNFGNVTIKAGYEQLGSDAGKAAFSTPLSTVHAHNGWSDRALSLKTTANDNGIQDTYFSIGGKVAGVKLLGVYHMLEADNGGADIGDEINLLAVYKTKAGPVVGAKAAMFDSNTANNDTEKFWVWTEYKF
jgi:hypothetical protein